MKDIRKAGDLERPTEITTGKQWAMQKDSAKAFGSEERWAVQTASRLEGGSEFEKDVMLARDLDSASEQETEVLLGSGSVERRAQGMDRTTAWQLEEK